MGLHIARHEEKINITEAEELLRQYRFLKKPIQNEIDEFITRLPEPYASFARFRYQQSHTMTMEEVAEKLGYSTRTVYNFRKKILKWWVLFLTSDQSLHKKTIYL